MLLNNIKESILEDYNKSNARSMASIDACCGPEMESVFERWDSEEWRREYKRMFRVIRESECCKFVDCDMKTEYKFLFTSLRKSLEMAYRTCKDIDSSDWFEHWPDEIRENIANALNSLVLFELVGHNLDKLKDREHLAEYINEQKRNEELKKLAEYENC